MSQITRLENKRKAQESAKKNKLNLKTAIVLNAKMHRGMTLNTPQEKYKIR